MVPAQRSEGAQIKEVLFNWMRSGQGRNRMFRDYCEDALENVTGISLKTFWLTWGIGMKAVVMKRLVL